MEGAGRRRERRSESLIAKPEGHLKVNGMLLTPLVTHVRSPAPPLASIPLACLGAGGWKRKLNNMRKTCLAPLVALSFHQSEDVCSVSRLFLTRLHTKKQARC